MKKHLPIIIGIALPFLFIIIITLVIFIPKTAIHPEHNFLYSIEPHTYSYEYLNTYTVTDGKLTLSPLPRPTETSIAERYPASVNPKQAPDIYLYNVKDNSVRIISLEEAQKFTLDQGPTSPDGYIVEYRYGHNGVFELFGSNSSNSGYFVTKGSSGKKLHGMSQNDRYYYGGEFKFIGWVK